MILRPGDQGVDLSNYNHGSPIDYVALAAAKRFAYVLLTDGTTFVNPYAIPDAKGCQAQGMATGAYLFWRPDQSFDEQVNDFCKAYTAVGGWNLPPMIDCETWSNNGPAWTATQLGKLQTNLRTALGVDVGVYLNQDFYDNMAGAAWGWPFWLADPSNPTAPSKPCLLQQTGIGPVPGISGGVDLDVWRTTYSTTPDPPDTEEEMQTPTIPAFGQLHYCTVGLGQFWHKWFAPPAVGAPPLIANEAIPLPAGFVPAADPDLSFDSTSSTLTAKCADASGNVMVAVHKGSGGWEVVVGP